MKGYVYLILAAFSYASMGLLIKALSVDFGPFTQTFLRLAFSGLLTLLLVIFLKKHFLLKHKRDYALMALMGIVGYGLSIIAFTIALYSNTIGNTLFIMSSYPIFTALLAYIFIKEKFTKQLLVSFLLLLCALYLFFKPEGLLTDPNGGLFALIAGVTTSLYIVCSRIMTKRGNAPETITLWSVWLAVITSGVGALGFETMNYSPSMEAILIILLFGFFNFSAYNFMNKGFQTVQAGAGTMVLMIEPIIGAILGVIFFNEFPTFTFIGGGLLMILAVFIATVKPKTTSLSSTKTT